MKKPTILTNHRPSNLPFGKSYLINYLKKSSIVFNEFFKRKSFTFKS